MKMYFPILLAFLLSTTVLLAQKQEKLEVVIQNSHLNTVRWVDFTPDGKWFVTGSYDLTVKLWNSNGILVRTIIPSVLDNINSVAISPDGSRIAIIPTSENLEIWSADGNLLSKNEIIKKESWSPNITKISFTGDGKRLIAQVGSDRFVYINSQGIPYDTLDVKSPNKTISDVTIIYTCLKLLPNNNLIFPIRLRGENFKLKDELWVLEYSPEKKLVSSQKIDVHEFDSDDYHSFSISEDGKMGLFRVRRKLVGDSKDLWDFVVLDIVNKTNKKVDLVLDTEDESYKEFGGATGEVYRVPANDFIFSPIDRIELRREGRHGYGDYSFYTYDNEKNKMLQNFGAPTSKKSAAFFSNDNVYCSFKTEWADNDNRQTLTTTVMNTNDLSFKNLPKISRNNNDYFSPNGQYFVKVGWGFLYLFDLNGLKYKEISIKFSDDPRDVNSLSFTNDGSKFCMGYKKVIIFDSKGKKIKQIEPSDLGTPVYGLEIKDAAISPSGENLLIAFKNEFIKTDISGKIINRLVGDSSIRGIYSDGSLGDLGIDKMIFSPNGEMIACCAPGANIALLKPDGKLIKFLKGHTSGINSLSFSSDSKYLTTTSTDNTVRIWQVSTGESMVITGDDKDWIVYTNDGYFDASKNGGKFVGITIGKDGFAIDQFASRYNRPDMILKKMGFGTPELIAHYENQYKKRLRKLGITEEQLANDFHIPTATIKTSETKDKITTFTSNLTDDKFNLKWYNIFVNDVPLYGSYGKEITGMNADITTNVELTKGTNKIEVSCINEKGAESYRALTYANYNGETNGDLYLLAFGVSKYQNPSLNLQFADKDALDLSKAIESYKGKGFENVYTKILTNEQVTPNAIKASKDFVKNAKPDDTFILFIAGHGMHDKDAEATYYYLTSNADINNLKGTAADFETIEDLLQGIPPRNKLFLMDACESGEIDEEDQGQMIAAATGAGIASRGLKKVNVTGAEVLEATEAATSSASVSAKRSYLYQKDRYIYNDLVRRSGAIVFSSSKGGELSYERSDIENGLFTEYIMKALTTTEADKDGNGTVSTDELRNFVSAEVAKASGDLQHPTVDRDNIYQKFGFNVKLK